MESRASTDESRYLYRVPVIVLSAWTDLFKLSIRSNENPSSFFPSFFLWRPQTDSDLGRLIVEVSKSTQTHAAGRTSLND
jgi:hypothetical protein